MLTRKEHSPASAKLVSQENFVSKVLSKKISKCFLTNSIVRGVSVNPSSAEEDE